MTTKSCLSLIAAALFAAPASAQYWIEYDPSLNTLPQDQCFDYSSNVATPPTVANGILHQGPTTTGGTQVWSKSPNLAFDFAQGYSATVDIYVVSSTYAASICGVGQRAGWYFGAIDNRGRRVQVGVGSGNVFMTNYDTASVSANAPVVAFAMAGGWHTLDLEINGSGSALFIDGAQKLTMPLGTYRNSTHNYLFFGDASICGSSETKLLDARFSIPQPLCPGDFNRDCFLDIFDFNDFVTCFEGGACPPGRSADFNGDGFPDIFDFFDFVDAFEAGCLY